MIAPQKPEDWPRFFEQHLGSGDIEKVMMLYEPAARIIPPSSETAVGVDEIRRLVSGFMSTKTRMHGRVTKVVTADDTALLFTDWQGNTPGSLETHHKAIEILRRQADGTWKLIVGDPDGRK
jgi:ketosteroid isomerase-like protein